jgi:hypothetical protein
MHGAIMPKELAISHLQRRKIQGRVLIPFIAACREKFGDGPAKELVDATIKRLAVQDGERWAEMFGTGLAALKAVADGVWAGGGSLNVKVVREGEDVLDFNVTRCAYAEFYKDLGLADVGYLVHCKRDHAMIAGFNPGIEMTRTKTIMEGADCCDFRFRKSPAGEDT